MTEEEYLQKQIELEERLLAARQRHLVVMHAFELRCNEGLEIERRAAAEARISEKRAYDEAVAGIEAELRKLKADWIAEQYAANTTALKAELVPPA